jgi:hypothetical protein
VTVIDTAASNRASAADQARASIRLEGLELTTAGEALSDRYVAGELTGEQLAQEMVRLHSR